MRHTQLRMASPILVAKSGFLPIFDLILPVWVGGYSCHLRYFGRHIANLHRLIFISLLVLFAWIPTPSSASFTATASSSYSYSFIGHPDVATSSSLASVCIAGAAAGYVGNLSSSTVVYTGSIEPGTCNYTQTDITTHVANFLSGVYVSRATATVYSCPSTADLSVSTCTCKPGYTENRDKNDCVPKAEGATVSNVANSSKPQNCPVKVGAPITPLLGAETHTVDTGLSVGGQSLRITYDNRKVFSAASQGVSIKAFGNMPALGALWESSLHKNINFGGGGFGAQLMRGNGTVVSFKYNTTTLLYTATSDVNDTLAVISGGFRFTSGGIIETYNSAGKLTSVADASGNTLTYTYSIGAGVTAPAAGYLMTVSDNVGRSIKFEYALPAGGVAATDGLITKITNAANQSILVGYDAAQNLAAITWPDGKSQSYVYENAALPWAATGMVNENGTRHITWGYDAAGRATSTELAGGVNKYSVSYGTPPGVAMTQTYDAASGITTRTYDLVAPSDVALTLPNGQVSLINATTVQGMNVATGLSQPAGSGCSASNSASTYDANGNVTSKDDFAGQRSCFAYNAKNQEITRVEGLSNTAACSAVLPAGATLPAGARKITTTWHPDWRLPSSRTVPGSISNIVYHGQPDPLSANAAVANCTSAAALPNGKPLPLVCKNIIQMEDPVNAAGPGPFDPNAQYNSLLLHADGINGTTTFIDDGAAKKTLTVTGGASISSALKKFGTGSAAFSGGGYITAPAGTDFNFGSSPFTLEFYLRPTAISGFQGLLSTRLGGVYSPFEIDLQNNQIRILKSNAAVNDWELNAVFSGVTVAANVWQHVAIVGDGTKISVYVNGIKSPNTVAHTPFAALSGPLYIGNGGDGAFSGNMDEIRITKGVARYSAAFTPPTSQFFPNAFNYLPATGPDSSFTYDAAGRVLTRKDANNRTTSYAYYSDTVLSSSTPAGSYDPQFDKVSLMLHANGANASTTLIDDSFLKKTVVASGNARISTNASKFGGSSFYFDGSDAANTHIEIPADVDFDFSAAYTVEFWINPSAYKATNVWLYQQSNALGSAAPLRIDLSSSGTVVVLGSSDNTGWLFTSGFQSTSTAPIGAWTHIAVTDDGVTARLFVNGVLESSRASWLKIQSTYPLLIGGAYTSGDREFNGYMDDFRITKGVARYTANFTPATQEFLNGLILILSPADIGHTVGDLQSITNPAGHVTQFTLYDRAGRLRQMVDPKGVVTDISYTPRGWVSTVTTTPAGGTARTTSYAYDNAGQLTGVSQPDGTSLTYSYDAAHRLIGATDAKGNSVNYTLDNVGNRIAEEVRDPTGTLQRSISRSFDALNRLQQVTGAAQ